MTEQMSEAGNRLKQTASAWTGKAKGSARDAGAAADLYLHEYAWTSMLTVALIAGALGYYLGSSRR